MFDLTGSVAFVTGARRGMGKADALKLAEQGAKVVVADIDHVECEAVVKSIESMGGEALAVSGDVSKRDDVERMFDQAVTRFGIIDILVNNAGIYQSKPFLEITEAEWDKVMSINLKGQFLVAQRAAKEMKKQNYGRIINIASISSGGVGIGVPASVHYTASKGGVLGMTEAMAVDLAPFGILVNAVAPGGIDTPMANLTGKPSKDLDVTMNAAPLKRIGQPDEVAAAVVFLASREASYITGVTLYVDGGWLAA